MFQFDFNLWFQGVVITLCAAIICYFVMLKTFFRFSFDFKFNLKGERVFNLVKNLVESSLVKTNNETLRFKLLLNSFTFIKV